MPSKAIIFLLAIFCTSIAEATPIVNDPMFSITLVATGLGASAGIANDSEGNIFINDYRDPGTGSGRIHWFKPNGERAVINSNLYWQDGIAVLPNGNLLVSPDALYEVTRTGAVSPYLSGLSYPGHIEPDGSGNFYISEGGAGKITILHPDKSTETFASGLNNPNGTTFDDQGHLWVAEHFLGSVVELDSSGHKIREITGLRPFGPAGIEFWAGSIFVSNSKDASIVRIEKDGSWKYFATGFTGKANPPFIGPGDFLAVGDALYLTDADNLWKIHAVPEPATILLIAVGGGLLLGGNRIRRQQSGN